ncbi:GntR family transcriptional regulator [Pantoea sp. Ap-967]|uniref:GntR family transcriptional regulator n=1 Tax=Pantoea sp. Ap-967 TaxID=2608362 RepID=UPI00141DBCDF|nr:GntR family transcriptional regulator [Pantoea sp. Ap-967]NIE73394.1 GntR family transcriptional regulator [Pantoea sp. Ap-967]
MTQRTVELPAFEARRPVSDLEYVYSALKQSFMIGEFEPGQRLTLPLLAEAFGTSQMPIREAMNRLVVARALEALPRRSMRVPEATTAKLDALLPLRLLLEGEATRQAVAGDCGSLAQDLEAINLEMDAKVASEDRKGYLRLNQQFHFSVYRRCGNHELIDMIELLWMRYGPLMNIVRSQVLSSTGHSLHAAVISGIRENDPQKAADAIRADIEDAAASIRQAIEAQGPLLRDASL